MRIALVGATEHPECHVLDLRRGRNVSAFVRSQCQAAAGAYPVNGRAMSFRVAAGFLVDAVERGSHVHEIVGLA